MSASSRYSDSDIGQATRGSEPNNLNSTQVPNEEYDSDSSSEDEISEEKQKSKKPTDNAFNQQRLKAYNPVFSARMVIPLLIVIGVVFVPLGAAMWLASHRIEDFAIDYSHCEILANHDTWTPIPQQYLQYNLKQQYKTPVWKLATNESQQFEDERNVCQIQFSTPSDLKAPIYLFYRLEKFYANHRRYVKSYSEDQIIGKAASAHDVKHAVGQNCEPLSWDKNGKIIYPCGLIANSLFNDTYTPTLRGVNGTSDDYAMTNKGIAWSSDKNRFKKTKYAAADVVPPPNWHKRYPNGYTEENLPDIQTWEEFQNWMHPAAFSTFNKLVLRNDNDVLKAGTYQIEIGLHFPVLPFKGGKYIYFSQRSVMGGKNPFLGITWIAAGGICLVLALCLLVVNAIKPRKTGDANLLSWNKEAFKTDELKAE